METIAGYARVVAKTLVQQEVNNSMTFLDYVGAEFTKRVQYPGDPYTYIFEHGLDKMSPSTAEELAWQYSENGAALGAIYPHIIRKMFDQTHAAVPKEDWER